MNTKLLQFEDRISELEALADKVQDLAGQLARGQQVQPELSIKGQAWYRGAREILVQNDFSGLKEFDACYVATIDRTNWKGQRFFCDIEQYIHHGTSDRNKLAPGQVDHYQLFTDLFRKARSLLLSVVEEVRSREMPVRTQLSFSLSADEFDKAGELLSQSQGDESIMRASGVVARVALERHLFTVADSHSLQVIPARKKVEAQDILNALSKQNVLTAMQKSEFEGLFKIGNNCAHPKEVVIEDDVRRLITRGRELASVVL